jgi:glycogen phosphorylase
MWPDRFNNKTNGVTQRRWLMEANPGLAQLISANIGTGWITDLGKLCRLESCAKQSGFLDGFAANKARQQGRAGGDYQKGRSCQYRPAILFDTQAKRIHEYKRQLPLAAIINDYLAIVEDGLMPEVARTTSSPERLRQAIGRRE